LTCAIVPSSFTAKKKKGGGKGKNAERRPRRGEQKRETFDFPCLDKEEGGRGGGSVDLGRKEEKREEEGR